MCSPTNHSSLDSVQDGATALHVAAQNGHLRVIEVLIAAKAQVDVKDKVSIPLLSSPHDCEYYFTYFCTEWGDSIAHSQWKRSL